MKHPIVTRRRVTAALGLLSSMLLTACLSALPVKPAPEERRVFDMATLLVPDFKDLAPGQLLVCRGATNCQLAPQGQNLVRLLTLDPRRVFFACLKDAQVPCEQVTNPSGVNQCLVPQAAADLEALQREAARKCLGIVQVP